MRNEELSVRCIMYSPRNWHRWLIILLFAGACETVLKLNSNRMRPDS